MTLSDNSALILRQNINHFSIVAPSPHIHTDQPHIQSKFNMASLRLLLLPTLAAAHVTLNAPAPVGPFDEDNEGNAPCGGVTIDFSKDNVTDFHVGGEPIDLFLGHPTAGWLIRGTLDQTAASNWSQLYPIFTQTGLGDYCQPAVAAPESWVGKKGILGVVANAPDGLLYQVRNTARVPHFLPSLLSLSS